MLGLDRDHARATPTPNPIDAPVDALVELGLDASDGAVDHRQDSALGRGEVGEDELQDQQHQLREHWHDKRREPVSSATCGLRGAGGGLRGSLRGVGGGRGVEERGVEVWDGSGVEAQRGVEELKGRRVEESCAGVEKFCAGVEGRANAGGGGDGGREVRQRVRRHGG
eukprot:scaffold107667_cov63-Phaeocystis_antarctica.AAC.1